MAYSHFFFLEEAHLPQLLTLMKNKRNGQFVILGQSGNFADIAQYSDKFQNIKIITVQKDHLRMEDEL